MKLVLLFGNGAVGKMTVGQELTKITDLRLFYNHMTIEPVLEVFGEFNSTVIEKLRRTIFEEFAKSDKYGLIFTFMWAFDRKEDWDYIAYIREYMDANGLPVIELGSEQSNLICRITSEKIAFLQNGIEVAYISDDKLFITEAEILTSIIIGNFAFVPRANGNLSFVKVR